MPQIAMTCCQIDRLTQLPIQVPQSKGRHPRITSDHQHTIEGTNTGLTSEAKKSCKVILMDVKRAEVTIDDTRAHFAHLFATISGCMFGYVCR
jgi:hypothetical protein